MPPELVGRAGITSIGQCFSVTCHNIANRRDSMIDLHRPDPIAGKIILTADLNDVEGEYWIFGGWYPGEIGPDDIVEHMLLHCCNHRLCSMKGDGVILDVLDDDIVCQRRNTADMVKVRVGDEDVLQIPLFFFRQHSTD